MEKKENNGVGKKINNKKHCVLYSKEKLTWHIYFCVLNDNILSILVFKLLLGLQVYHFTHVCHVDFVYKAMISSKEIRRKRMKQGTMQSSSMNSLMCKIWFREKMEKLLDTLQ